MKARANRCPCQCKKVAMAFQKLQNPCNAVYGHTLLLWEVIAITSSWTLHCSQLRNREVRRDFIGAILNQTFLFDEGRGAIVLPVCFFGRLFFHWQPESLLPSSRSPSSGGWLVPKGWVSIIGHGSLVLRSQPLLFHASETIHHDLCEKKCIPRKRRYCQSFT